MNISSNNVAADVVEVAEDDLNRQSRRQAVYFKISVVQQK
jgi:hypothetical protein